MKINNNIEHGGIRGVERTETRVASLTFYNLSAYVQLITEVHAGVVSMTQLSRKGEQKNYYLFKVLSSNYTVNFN